jgi:hypothetical protein
MSPLSRRAFLIHSGALAGVSRFGTGTPLQATAGLAGRALTLADIHVRPDSSSPVLRQLPPDSVVTIAGLSRDGSWYQIQDSFVQREALQPIVPYNRPEVVDGVGFWAEVIAPVSPIRAWCAGAAPIQARPGFGAVLYVGDRIEDDHRLVWYGVAESPGSPLVGWAPALHFVPWTPAPQIALSSPRIVIGDGKLVVLYGKRKVGEAAIYGPRLPTTETTVRAVAPGGSLGSRFGVPWLTELGTGRRLYGAYWHNRFGSVSDCPDFELGTFAARWLYGLVVETASVGVGGIGSVDHDLNEES